MTDLFSALLDQSLTACWVIPAVLLLRFCLKKAPKRVTNLLWLVVAFRLVCPVSFESDVSLVTQAQNLSHAAAELRDEVEAYRPVDSQPTVTLPEDTVFAEPAGPVEPVAPEAPSLPQQMPEAVVTPEEPTRAEEQPFVSRQLVLRAGCGIWLAGTAAMALFGLISTRQWRKRVQTAVRCEDGLWRSESVESPFILGVLRPRIYLPFVLPQGAEGHVIAHERAHLKRRDPLLKCLAFGLLSVYWFHPLVWVSYFLFCRDIELACDQQVTRELDAEGKKAYSRALLACTVSGDPLLCPLSFGEVGVKARIKAVLQKKPSKVFVFTALVLCTVLIICCAADPKRELPWEEAFEATLEELIFQYGANEEYGLQSVTTLDLWEDGVPELVVVRKMDATDDSEGEIIVYLYEYVDGQVQPRAEQYFDGDAEIQWKAWEGAVQIMGSSPLTDRASYPDVRAMKALWILDQTNQNGYYSVVVRNYTQIDDGRWIVKQPSYSSESSRFLTEEETADLFDGAQSLMGLDFNNVLKNHRDAAAYQRAYYDALELGNKSGASRFTTLVDFDLDGIPEMITEANNKFYVYRYDTERKAADLLRSIDLNPPPELECDWRLYLNMTLERPTLIVLKTYHTSEFMEVYTWGDGNMAHHGAIQIFYAKGDAMGQRQDLTDHQGWLNGESITDPAEYEAARAAFLLGATEFDYQHFPQSAGGYDDHHVMRNCQWPVLEVPQAADYPGYREVLTGLISQYGLFDGGDGSQPVLGLKYAALRDFGEDGCPELVTLVNHKDQDLRLHMTLRVYGCDQGETVLRYATELGARYGQTDVSYTFALGGNCVVTYHSTDEWTEELIHMAEHLGSGTPTTRVYRATRENSDDFPAEGTLTQFWEDGEAVSLGRYGTVMAATVDRYRQIDACWNVSPASESELMVFLEKMGVDTAAAPDAGVVNEDSFTATIVGDFDGQTLVQRRYHTDCYSGMAGCEDCYYSELVLWNAERTESVKLLENVPFAELFTVTAQYGDQIFVTYYTGPAHSECDQQITLRIDLEEKTCVQAGREWLSEGANSLIAAYPHTDNRYTTPLRVVIDNAPAAQLPPTWDKIEDMIELVFPDGETWTLYRNGKTVYAVDDDGQTKKPDPMCIELLEAMGLENIWGAMGDYARQLHEPSGFVLEIDGQQVAVDSDFAMLDWFGANHVPMLDVEQLGELLNVPVDVTDGVIQTQPEGLRASMGFNDTWITVTDGKQHSEVQCFYNPATFEGRHYVPADALRGLFSAAMTYTEKNDVWTLELTTLDALKAMAADAATQLGAVYTPRGPMEDRLMVGYQTVVDYGGGQALMNFTPGLDRIVIALGPVLHRMTMLDRGYLRSYENNGTVTQSLYAQTVNLETIPLEYDEITCIDQRVQLYSLKKDGKYGFASIPWGSYEATISPCKWDTPLTITEMCSALATYHATGEW